MPSEVTPAKFQNVVKRGFERIHRYRKARAMFMREFVGQYYRVTRGMSGDEPLNLMFKVLSSFIPTLVTHNPINEVSSRFMPYKPYAELLGLTLDQVDKDIDLKEVLRGWITSAYFAFGVIKTGIASSECMIQYGDQLIDPGQVYAELVDLDDFVLDPICTDLRKSSFLGSRSRVPRQILLDDDSFDSEMVKRLPTSKFNETERVDNFTKQSMAASESYTLQDYVDVVECWVPEADATVTMSDPRQIILPRYLKTIDYYGPAEGPYTFLSFTPPVQGNPLPIAPVSQIYDLHRIANRTFKRQMHQADREKSILIYKPAFADEVQDLIDAIDGDSVAVTDPEGAKTMTFGGVNPKNTEMIQQFHMWLNYMAGSPDEVAGQTARSKGGRETATKAAIMQSNASIGIEDARKIIADQTAKVNRNIGWYIFHDPLIKMPLIKREDNGEFKQMIITPDQRQGTFFDYAFQLRERSMTPVDAQQRARLMLEFATSVMPTIMQSAMVAMQMGQQFNVSKALMDLAEQTGITADVSSWLDDPAYAQKMDIMMKLGPQNPGKATGGGNSGGGSSGGVGSTPRLMQNQQSQQNQDSQTVAGEAQQAY